MGKGSWAVLPYIAVQELLDLRLVHEELKPQLYLLFLA